MKLRFRDRLERWLEALWDGRRPWATLLLFAPFGLLSVAVRCAGTIRRGKRRRPASLPVISIGNLRVGGTGKTQVALELCGRAQAQGLSPAVVLRGYGGTERGPLKVRPGDDPRRVGDEALLLARRRPGTLVIVAHDRWAGVELARAEGRNWVALDDGAQQRDVEPSHNVIVVPAERPFGNGHLLPLGPLREPRSRLSARDLIWMHGESAAIPGLTAAVRSRTRVVGLAPAEELSAAVLPLDTATLAAFCAIARPERFWHTLESAGARLVARWPLGDHRLLSPAELAEAVELAVKLGAAALVCTEKDAVRLPRPLDLRLPILALRVELEIQSGAECVGSLLEV